MVLMAKQRIVLLGSEIINETACGDKVANRREGAAAQQQGQLLFIKRSELLQNESEVSWDIPGGRIEPHETLVEGLRREVREELGVDLEGTPQLVNAQDIFVPAKNLHVVRLTYVLDVNIDSTALRLSDEHQDIAWLSLHEAIRVNTEPFLSQTLAAMSAE